MFLIVLKKKKKTTTKKQFNMEFIYCRRLNSQYFGAPKSRAPKMRGPPRFRVLRGWFIRHCSEFTLPCYEFFALR